MNIHSGTFLNYLNNNKLIFIIIISLIVLLFFIMLKVAKYNFPKKITHNSPNKKITTLQKELYPFGLSYNKDYNILISNLYCWQRKYGYFSLLDEALPPLGLIVDCEPVTFIYNDKRWLIEFWKGQYGIATGVEIGIYNTSKKDYEINDYWKGPLYKAATDKEMLNINFKLRKKGQILFSRQDTHWWLTGFLLGEFSEPQNLEMDISITFPTYEMRDCFKNSLFKLGYKPSKVFIKYKTVIFTYSTPYNPQPSTRTPTTEHLVQKNNQLYCKSYEYITRNVAQTPDKIAYLKEYFPSMYNNIVTIGKSRQLFTYYDLFK